MDENLDFFGLSFDAVFLLFGDEFGEVAGVYVVYTKETCLEVGTTFNLKRTMEEHPHTKQWVDKAAGKEILVAFHQDEDQVSQEDKVTYLQGKMPPLLTYGMI